MLCLEIITFILEWEDILQLPQIYKQSIFPGKAVSPEGNDIFQASAIIKAL